MVTTDKESSAVGTDNRPPMLVESDYESWKILIERYICGKPLGKLIWRSIQNGPTPHPQITVTEDQGTAAVQVTRDKLDEEFTEIENNKELADIQATNILSQGLPRHVFNILNQTPAQSSNDAMLATMNQIVNLLSGFQKQFPPTNNQLRTSSNLRSHATVHDGQIVTETVQRKASSNVGNTGHVLRQCKEKKKVKDSQHFKDKMLLIEAKEKGAVLDAEAEAFLADVECTAPYDKPLTITTTNNFKVSHEDAYDSDVDEGPHAAAAFMANLSSTSGTNSATTSHVNEVSSVSPGEISMITILDDLRNQLDGHLKVNQKQSMVNDSLRAELARSLGSSNPWYAKQAKIAQPTLYDGHALVKPTNTPVRVHDSEESLVQAEKELSREQVYWLPAEELATQKSNPPKPVTLFVHTCPAPSKVCTQLLKLKDCFPVFETIIKRRTTPTFHEQWNWRFVHNKKAFTEQVIPFYEHVKELVQNLDENLVKEVTKFMRIFDELDKEFEQCVLEKKK
nr:hypothetical protein [Tanacetum cinerariifolium]